MTQHRYIMSELLVNDIKELELKVKVPEYSSTVDWNDENNYNYLLLHKSTLQ